MKRLFDILVALGLVLVCAPLCIAIAVAIKLDSKGPTIFRQTRVGRGGGHFDIFKFRTMVADAPKLGGHSTQENDPRITNVGRFLRRTSLDEIPQILNVLAGEMSLVGPRPNVPAQKAEYTDAQWAQRHSVRPGITGLAQATLRSEATWDQRLELDLTYVEKTSLIFDLKVMLLTVKQVAFKGGN